MDTTTSKARSPSRAGSRIIKVARLLAFSLFVSMALGLCAFRSAYANLKKQSLSMGRQISQAGEAMSDVHRVLINGEPIWVTNVNVDKSKKEVLDSIEKACVERSGGISADFDKMPAEFRKGMTDHDRSKLSTGVMREEVGREGTIACVLQKGDGGLKALGERLSRFAGTFDVGDVGDFRYAYVKETGNSTRVLTAWTNGSFRMRNVLPTQGDAAGTDPTNMPRPNDAKRILSAEVEGAPYGVRIYESTMTPSAVFDQYAKEMPTLGWDTLPNAAAIEDTTRMFSRPGVDVLVIAREDQGRTFVSLVESVMHETATTKSAQQ